MATKMIKLSLTLMALMLSHLASGQEPLKPMPRTREEVNSQLDRQNNGVYFLSQGVFDDFINYNDLVLICFYETGDLEPILSEILASISRRVQDQQSLFEVAMVTIDRAPMLEARYTPVNAPDFRIFYKARNIKYYGKLDPDLLADWTMRKIGLPNNRIRSLKELKNKLEKSQLIVIFIAERDTANRYFNDYLEVSRKLLTLDDVEFAFLYPQDFGNDMAHLERVTKKDFYEKFQFGIRVYRRGNLADIKDMNRWSLRSEEEVAQIDMENFIFKSTFVGQGPDYIREANSDNMMKFFSQNQPGLLLFYSSDLLKAEDEATKNALSSLESVFDTISGRIIVAKIDVLTALGKKLMQVTNVDAEEALLRPFLRIIDPNQSNNAILKYKPEKEDELPIGKDEIKNFVNDFVGGGLKKFLKTQKDPQTPATMQLPITALSTDSFKALMDGEPNKDIFIFFAGPACFSCPAVWPEFQKLVRVLHEKSTGIMFAFVDLSQNELQEEAKIFSFPSLRLYPANTDRTKTWINFTQSPTYLLLTKFLKQNTKATELEADEAQLRKAEEEEQQLNEVLSGQEAQTYTTKYDKQKVQEQKSQQPTKEEKTNDKPQPKTASAKIEGQIPDKKSKQEPEPEQMISEEL